MQKFPFLIYFLLSLMPSSSPIMLGLHHMAATHGALGWPCDNLGEGVVDGRRR